ncbi:hypothetical protein LOK49_Contig17G00010 [Camellia lanceoleosa]|nr:hypothetical protein LOK49_Contig17G00010 [Camellia lanceoleosa]
MSASVGSSSSNLVESDFLKVPISEFANSVRSTIDVVQQVATLVSRFAEFANSVRSTIEVVQQVASLVSGFAEFANSVRLTIEVVQQVASLVSRFAGAFSDFRLSKAIADCLDLHDLSADKLTRTLSASQSPNERSTTSMVDLTEFANSEIGTFKNSDSTKSELELPSEADIHTTTDKNNSKKMEGREGPI